MSAVAPIHSPDLLNSRHRQSLHPPPEANRQQQVGPCGVRRQVGCAQDCPAPRDPLSARDRPTIWTKQSQDVARTVNQPFALFFRQEIQRKRSKPRTSTEAEPNSDRESTTCRAAITCRAGATDARSQSPVGGPSDRAQRHKRACSRRNSTDALRPAVAATCSGVRPNASFDRHESPHLQEHVSGPMRHGRGRKRILFRRSIMPKH